MTRERSVIFFPVAVGRRCQLPSCEKNKLPAYGYIRDTTCLPTDRPGGQRRHPYASPQAEERIYLIPSCRCPALHPKVPSCWSHDSIRVSRNAAMESVFKWNFCQKKYWFGEQYLQIDLYNNETMIREVFISKVELYILIFAKKDIDLYC